MRQWLIFQGWRCHEILWGKNPPSHIDRNNCNTQTRWCFVINRKGRQVSVLLQFQKQAFWKCLTGVCHYSFVFFEQGQMSAMKCLKADLRWDWNRLRNTREMHTSSGKWKSALIPCTFSLRTVDPLSLLFQSSSPESVLGKPRRATDVQYVNLIQFTTN